MKRISIRQPIIDAIDETDSSLSRFQNQMLKWAKYLEKEIGSKHGYKIRAQTITVDGATITLPDDCYRVLMLIPGDHEDEANIQYINMTWPNVRSDEEDHEDDDYSWLWRPAETMYVQPYLWEEIADELNLLYEYTDTEMTIVYQQIETDRYGFWIINESHSDAIKKYIKFMVAGKYNWKLFKSDKMLRQGHITFVEQLRHDYNVAVRHARAEDGRETPFQTEQY